MNYFVVSLNMLLDSVQWEKCVSQSLIPMHAAGGFGRPQEEQITRSLQRQSYGLSEICDLCNSFTRGSSASCVFCGRPRWHTSSANLPDSDLLRPRLLGTISIGNNAVFRKAFLRYRTRPGINRVITILILSKSTLIVFVHSRFVDWNWIHFGYSWKRRDSDRGIEKVKWIPKQGVRYHSMASLLSHYSTMSSFSLLSTTFSVAAVDCPVRSATFPLGIPCSRWTLQKSWRFHRNF